MGSGALFFDETDKFLIVKPTYKSTWEIPGGGIAEGESPINAMKREIKEELGFDVVEAKLLCVEYIPNDDDKGDRVQFIFDGGVLTKDQIKTIQLQIEELSEYKFVSVEESLKLLGEKLHQRVPAATQARTEKRIIYLESFQNCSN